MSEEFKAHIQKFNLKKESSFVRGDAEVVKEARRLAARADNTLTIVSTEQGYDLYTMMDETELKSSAKGGCFVATAAYGYPFAPEVLVFRRFRDEILLTSKLGESLVKIYYNVSPRLALIISKRKFLRIVVRSLLLAPILRLLKARN